MFSVLLERKSDIMKKLYNEYNYFMDYSGYSAIAQFKSFARKAKNRLEKDCSANGLELRSYSKGYYEVSGFIFNPTTSKYAYFAMGDMRFDHLGKKPLDACLIRTASNEKDFTGGNNHFCPCYDLVAMAKKLTK